MAAQLRGSEQVAVSFMGDGATDIGVFHESLNLAALWDLPVVFVVENNGYADFIAQRDHQRIEQVSARAAGYGMVGETVDGNDVEEVQRAAGDAVDRARGGRGPTLLECVTYRWRGHFEGDPQPYRSQDEVEAWKERDPLGLAERRLAARGQFSEAEREAIRRAVQAKVADAVQFAETAAMPDPMSALEDVSPTALRRDGELSKLSYAKAVALALREAMAEDPAVFCLGEDVGFGGAYGATQGLREEFGADRVRDTRSRRARSWASRSVRR